MSRVRKKAATPPRRRRQFHPERTGKIVAWQQCEEVFCGPSSP